MLWSEHFWKMLVEVAIFATGLYLVLRFLRETRGSGVIRGLSLLLLLGVITFVTLINVLQLERLAIVFNAVGNIAILGLIVIFQPEIRRAIVKLGDSRLFRRFLKREVRIISRLLRSVARLSRDHIGALIAIEREGSLSTLAETGITIDAELNSYLIEAVFYPGSALHDGAIVVREDRIVAASCLLPLSQNPEVDKRLGTRHRAALGLAEETDALAIVVSEETGKVSAAIGGKLKYGLTLEELEHLIEEALKHRGRSGAAKGARTTRGGRTWDLLRDPWRKVAAVVFAALLWWVLDNQVNTEFVARPMEILLNETTGTGRDKVLVVDLPTDDGYELDQIFDGESNEPVDSIALHLKGARNLIAGVQDRLVFHVAAEEVNDHRDGYPFVTFQLEDIEHRNPEYDALISRLVPRTVRLVLVKMSTRRMPLQRSNVKFVVDDAGLRTRIDQKDLTFSPAEVVFIGPETQLKTLGPHTEIFRATVSPADLPGDGTRGRVTLSLAEEYRSWLRMNSPLPAVSFAISKGLQPVWLKNVVVVLDTAQLRRSADAEQLMVLPEQVDVMIHAGSALYGILHKEADRQKWVDEHARIRVFVSPQDLATLQSGDIDVLVRKPRVQFENFRDTAEYYVFNEHFKDGQPSGQIEIKFKADK